MNSILGRMVVASLLSAVVIFLFGFVYWTMVPMPEWGNLNIPEMKLDDFNDAVKSFDKGTYVTQQYTGEPPEIFQDRVESKPVIVMSIDPDGAPMPDMMGMAEGLLHGWLSAFVVCVMLTMAAPGLSTFGARFCFVITAGVFGSMWCQIGDSIWWHRSCGSTTWLMVYDIVAWSLAAVVLAAMVNKTPAPEGIADSPAGDS